MLRFLLDTNLCIRVLRDRSPSLRDRFNRDADGLAISTIVLTELLHGAAKSARPEHNRREIENFAARFEVLPFDAAAADRAADIRASLERQGRSIGGYDVLIAGHARSRGLIVVPGNRGEFDRVDGLRCEDWRRSGLRSTPPSSSPSRPGTGEPPRPARRRRLGARASARDRPSRSDTTRGRFPASPGSSSGRSRDRRRRR